jgi:hypothetical protein
VRRPSINYAEGGGVSVIAYNGVDVSEPVAGFYRFRLSRGSIAGGVHIWFGAPCDPVTGEEMDRGWRWQAEFCGEPLEFDRCWPVCADEPITEAEYRAYCARVDWARENAPNSAFAKPGRRFDPLSNDNPLPF